jgi:hypothetical protein
MRSTSIKNLNAKTQRTQRYFIVLNKELLCALCVFAVKMLFMANGLQGISSLIIMMFYA